MRRCLMSQNIINNNNKLNKLKFQLIDHLKYLENLESYKISFFLK